MSTELTYTNPSELAAYLATLADNKGDIDKDINPNKMSPRICMSKDNDLLTVKLVDSVIGSPQKYLYVLIEHSVGNKSLWAPQNHPHKENYKGPICTTGLIPTVGIDASKGVFTHNADFPPPYVPTSEAQFRIGEESMYECSKCPFNKFESERIFDSSKDASRGKACKEARLLFVRVMKKVNVGDIKMPNGEELSAFTISEEYGADPLRLNLPLGSNKKPFEDMVVAARARNLPVASSVWKLGVTINDAGGGIRYPSAKFEFVGFPVKEAFNKSKEDKGWIDEYVERNKRVAMESDINF